MQMQFAEQLFRDTNPIRQGLFDRSEQFLGGGMDVRETPSYEALKLATDTGFNQAKDNTIARFAPGGGLIDAMTQLEGDRAGTLTEGAANIYGSELDRATGLATGTTNQVSSLIGGASNTQAMLAQANAQTTAAGKGALGSAAGGYFGGK